MFHYLDKSFNLDMAYDYMKSRSTNQYAVRGALAVLHGWYLAQMERMWEETYDPLLDLNPSAPADRYAFYVAVAQSVDDVVFPQSVVTPANGCRLYHVEQAVSFVDDLTDETVKDAMRRFIDVCRSDALPNGAELDLLYCCRLLSDTVFSKELYERVITGEIARESDRMDEDKDGWS